MPTFLPESGGNQGMAATLAATTWCREDGDEMIFNRTERSCVFRLARIVANVVVAQMFRLDKQYIRSPFRVGFTV